MNTVFLKLQPQSILLKKEYIKLCLIAILLLFACVIQAQISANISTFPADGEITLGESVSFNASGSTSSSPIMNYLWNFGDNTTGSGITTTHTFLNPGIYEVSLVIFNIYGQGAETTKKIYVSAPCDNYEIRIPIKEDATIQAGSTLNEATIAAGPNKTSYLKINTEGLEVYGNINATELELLYSPGQDTKTGNVQLYLADNTPWSEGTLIATDAPEDSLLLDEQNRTYESELIYWDLSNAAPLANEFSVILSTASTNSFSFGSSEYPAAPASIVIRVSNPNCEGQFFPDTPFVPEPMHFEAECAIVGNNWKYNPQGTASNDIALFYPGSGQAFHTEPTEANQRVRFAFFVPETTTYDVYTRILVKNAKKNSFWVRIDGNPWIKFSDIPRKGSFKWEHVFDNNHGGQTVTHTFTSGTHAIDVAVYEYGTQLDKLALIPPGESPPDREGPLGLNCIGSNATNNAYDLLEKTTATKVITTYPNPFTEDITIDLQFEQAQVDVQIYDSVGKLMENYQGVNGQERLVVGKDLPKGIYFIRLQADGEIHHQKIYKTGL